jgi:hypothetical protein
VGIYLSIDGKIVKLSVDWIWDCTQSSGIERESMYGIVIVYSRIDKRKRIQGETI